MISTTSLLWIAGAVAAVYAVFQIGAKIDDRVEKRRLAAGELALILREMGLQRIPSFLTKYSVGDYSGCFADMASLVQLFVTGGKSAVLEEFKVVFERVLTAKLKTKEGRAYVETMLAQANASQQSEEDAAVLPTD